MRFLLSRLLAATKRCDNERGISQPHQLSNASFLAGLKVSRWLLLARLRMRWDSLKLKRRARVLDGAGKVLGILNKKKLNVQIVLRN